MSNKVWRWSYPVLPPKMPEMPHAWFMTGCKE